MAPIRTSDLKFRSANFQPHQERPRARRNVLQLARTVRDLKATADALDQTGHLLDFTMLSMGSPIDGGPMRAQIKQYENYAQRLVVQCKTPKAHELEWMTQAILGERPVGPEIRRAPTAQELLGSAVVATHSKDYVTADRRVRAATELTRRLDNADLAEAEAQTSAHAAAARGCDSAARGCDSAARGRDAAARG
jgi:hypothetical protein